MIAIADRISIVMACDEGYAMPLATALRSIADSNVRHWPLDAYVLYDQFQTLTRKQVERSLPEGSISLHWLQIDLERFADLTTLDYISRMTFARFLISDLLPPELPRVLYLDSDLLVIGDVGALWSSHLDGNCAGAVPDDGFDSLPKRQLPQHCGMPHTRRYFNAGVLLIDLDRWREQRIGERATQYLAKRPDSPFADQDALNSVLEGSWLALPEHWNFQHHLKVSVSEMSPEARPAIVHFVTAKKPWKREFHTPNESLFDHYRAHTRFSRTVAARLADSRKSAWFLLKQFLKRFAPVQRIASRMKSGR